MNQKYSIKETAPESKRDQCTLIANALCCHFKLYLHEVHQTNLWSIIKV